MSSVNELILAVTFIFLLLAGGVVTFLWVLQRRHVRYVQERSDLIWRTQLEIQEQTLQSISEEIHDNIGSLLSTIKINLNNIEDAALDFPQMNRLRMANELLGKAIVEVRNISKGISLDFIREYGLEKCIEFELERYSELGTFLTSFEQDGELRSLPLSCEFVLYRVVQEVLSNVSKHASASELHVSLKYNETDCYVISITDNGVGFEYADIENRDARASGSGLRNIYNRMRAIGGTAEVKTGPKKGTEIRLIIPTTK